MKQKAKIIDVTIENVEETGFFCYMSKRKSEGYSRKLSWLKERFDEGMKIKMLGDGERGFIEYIPGHLTWRCVKAKGYMFIHCIWVVGQSKGKGHAKVLLDACIKDAKKLGMDGVAMVTAEGNWLVGKELFLKNGFESVSKAPPAFELLVKKFRAAPSPSFVKGIDQRASKYKSGLTVFRSDQCPYLEDATNNVKDTAAELGLEFKVIEMKSARAVQTLSPSVFGVFSIVYRGHLLSYHYLLQKDLRERIGFLDA